MYKKKYFKYKKKYLELKQKKLVGGNCKFNVVPNSGYADGMTNQCLWISIRDYINIFLQIPITLIELRQHAELESDTEHSMFDNDDIKFITAINKIAVLYNLTINFYLIDNNGDIITKPDINGNPQTFMKYGNGKHIVNITSFGMYHFQLILDGCGLPEISPEVMNYINNNNILPKIIKSKIFYKNEFIDIDNNFVDHPKDLNDILIENKITNIKNQIKLHETSKQIYNETIELLNDKITQEIHELKKIENLSDNEKNIIMSDQIENTNYEKDNYYNLITSTVEIIEKLRDDFKNLNNYKNQINTYYNLINQANNELTNFNINLKNLNLSDEEKITIISEYEHNTNTNIQEFNTEIRKFEELIQKIK